MNKPLVILEFPSNLGLKMPRPNHEPGVKTLPASLHKFGFHEALKPERILHIAPPPYSVAIDSKTGIRNLKELKEYISLQEKVVKRALDDGSLRSCAVGCLPD